MMSVFVDSTTILYTLDPAEPRKRAICSVWLKSLRLANAMILSPQVLNETYAVICRKPAFAAMRSGIRDHLADYMVWATAPFGVDTLTGAWRLQDRHGIGFWDALLLASANAAGCGHFLTEDLNDGQLYDDVRVVDPFRHAPEDVLGRARP